MVTWVGQVLATPRVDPSPVGNSDAGPLVWRLASTSILAVLWGAAVVFLLPGGSVVPVWTVVIDAALGVAVLGKVWGSSAGLVRRASGVLALVLGAVGTTFLVVYLIAGGITWSSLPSAHAAISFALLAWAVYSLDRVDYSSVVVGATTLITAAFIPMVALLGGGLSWGGDLPGNRTGTMPAGTAILLILLCLATMAARPRRLPLGPLSESGAMPIVLAGVIGLGLTLAVSALLSRSGAPADEGPARSTLVLITQIVMIAGVVGMALLLSQRQQRRRDHLAQVTAAERAFDLITSRSEVGFGVVDESGRLVETNPALLEFLGMNAASAIGLDWEELTSQTADLSVNGLSVRMHFDRPDGRRVWGDVLATQGSDGRSILLQVVDRSEDQGLRATLERRANFDSTTGVLSRQAILEGLEGFAGRSGPEARVVCLVDVDRFHVVNDAFPTQVGDEALAVVAARIAEALGSLGMVGRMHGDVFLAIGGPGSAARASTAATRMIEAVGSTEFTMRGLHLTASAGVTVTRHGATANELTAEGFAALSAAKDQGANRVLAYGDHMRSEARLRLERTAELRELVQAGDPDGRLMFWFQPVVDLLERRTTGYEALARWEHPELGILTAASFMESAEDDIELVQWIGLRALDAAAALGAREGPDVRVAVNLSGVQLANSLALGEFVDRAVDLASDPRLSLGVEITETALARLSHSAVEQLERLVAGGCALYVDDFGSGYSSVAHLRDLPVGVIKLDREFTEAAMHSEAANRLAAGVAALAAVMGIETIAEGIETEAHAHMASEAGWRLGQGWSLGMPEPR